MSKVVMDNLKDFLNVKNISEDKAELFFYGDIVSDWWGAWDEMDQYPESVKNFLSGVQGKDLDIHINSGGGSVFAGITIYNMLKNFKGYKTVYIDGLAASIASVIALAGDKVVMRTGSSFMIHKPATFTFGCYNSDELKEMADMLDVIQKCILQVYQENLKDTTKMDEVEALMNAETWFTSDEAINYFNIEKDSFEAVACISDIVDKYAKSSDFIARNNEKIRIESLKRENKNKEREKELKNAQTRLRLLEMEG